MSVDLGPIINPANGHTYYRLTPSTWTAAEAEAVALGGHLVTINDAAENQWVFDQFKNPSQFGLWIGLNDVNVEGQFVWVSGETSSYRNWISVQPDNFGGNENWAHIWIQGSPNFVPPYTPGKWNDFGNEATAVYTVATWYLQGVVEVATTPKDINLVSAQLQAENTVQFTYETTGNPGPFEVGLYRSTDGITYNPADLITVTIPPVTPSPTNPQAPVTFTLPSPWTPDPSKPYLIVAADPDDFISESDPNNNQASVRLPDLAVFAFTWSTSTRVVNGLDIRYEINGANLPEATTITLYWANGDLILQPAHVIAAETTAGVHILHIPLASLSPVPGGATQLILAADPPTDTMLQGKVLESNEGNNVRVAPLYAFQNSSITFDPVIADRLDRLAREYYGATGKILVITSGFRSPIQEAQAIARLISSRQAQGDNIRQALRHVRGIYNNGRPINLVLRNYDITKTPDQNSPAMATVISQLLDAWYQQGQPGRRPPISYHLAGWAVDLSITGMTRQDQQTLKRIAIRIGLRVGGDEGGDPHIHISFPRT